MSQNLQTNLQSLQTTQTQLSTGLKINTAPIQVTSSVKLLPAATAAQAAISFLAASQNQANSVLAAIEGTVNALVQASAAAGNYQATIDLTPLVNLEAQSDPQAQAVAAQLLADLNAAGYNVGQFGVTTTSTTISWN